MTTKENFKETYERIRKNEELGLVTVMTVCGMMSMPIEKFCRQSADGLLFDLNRDEANTVFLGSQGLERWVNDYATAKVIRYLINQLEETKKCKKNNG